jgi:predicted naringenin-chalcone synthase
MSVWIHRLETAVPPTRYSQAEASAIMVAHAARSRVGERIIRGLYRNSGIEHRHSVVEKASETGTPSLFFTPAGDRHPTVDTAARNAVYTREAERLFIQVARALVEGTPGFSVADITHVITISCTGFSAPGPEIQVIRALGLSPSTQRYHIGFMGCYAAVQGLRLAEALCRRDPAAAVLVLSVELCTLHLQFSEDLDDLIAGAVFADGGGGALVSARTPAEPGSALELLDFRTTLMDGGAEDMAWTLGNHGFRMKLSTYVPELIGRNLTPVVEGLLHPAGLRPEEIPWWAVHPGGRAILDRVEAEAGLFPGQLAAARAVLRDYGNMSSATLLFVLRELLERGETTPGDRVLGMAFGPGLTVESLLLRVGPHAG